VRGDNIESVPSWVFNKDEPMPGLRGQFRDVPGAGPFFSWTAAEAPPEVDDEQYPPSVEVAATRNRDGLLLGVAVLVIVAVLAYLLGRAS
jgi:hypothetical protein